MTRALFHHVTLFYKNFDCYVHLPTKKTKNCLILKDDGWPASCQRGPLHGQSGFVLCHATIPPSNAKPLRHRPTNAKNRIDI